MTLPCRRCRGATRPDAESSPVPPALSPCPACPRSTPRALSNSIGAGCAAERSTAGAASHASGVVIAAVQLSSAVAGPVAERTQATAKKNCRRVASRGETERPGAYKNPRIVHHTLDTHDIRLYLHFRQRVVRVSRIPRGS